MSNMAPEVWYRTAEWWDGDLHQAAANLAIAAHRGQRDKAGQSYIRAHVGDVVDRLDGESPEVMAVAWLHDVLEDTDVEESRLRDRSPAEVVDAVMAITHLPNEPRADYYARVKANPIALKVKLADIASNTDPERMALLDEATRERLTEKYRKALVALA